MHEFEHTLHGRPYTLCLTARALFTIYDRYGYTTTIVDDLKLDDESLEGFSNLCWLYALLAQQGELRRRHLGYEAQPLLTPEELKILADPQDVPELKTAVLQALALGFGRSVPDGNGERDLVLEQIEANEKKGLGRALTMLATCLRARPSST